MKYKRIKRLLGNCVIRPSIILYFVLSPIEFPNRPMFGTVSIIAIILFLVIALTTIEERLIVINAESFRHNKITSFPQHDQDIKEIVSYII
jgi:hypothetical protein